MTTTHHHCAVARALDSSNHLARKPPAGGNPISRTAAVIAPGADAACFVMMELGPVIVPSGVARSSAAC